MLRWKVCFKLQMACYIFLGLFYVVWIFLQGLLGNYYLLGVLGEVVEYVWRFQEVTMNQDQDFTDRTKTLD